MSPLVRILFVLALALLVLFLAPSLIGEKGYVLISFGHYTIELTLVSLAFILLVSSVLVFVAFKLFKISASSVLGVSHWFSGQRASKNELAFYNGLHAMMLGDNVGAKENMQKVAGNRFHGLNYLALGQLALQNQDEKEASDWFERTIETDDTHAQQTAKLLQAQHLIINNRPQKALELIDQISAPLSSQGIKIKAQALAAANEWQTLEDHLTKWKKHLGSQYDFYAQSIASSKFAEIASKQGANQLKAHWQELPRKSKNMEAVKTAYLNQLVQQGMHQDASSLIVQWYVKKPIPEAILTIIKQLKVSRPTELIALLEKWIKETPENVNNYASLGHLAFHAGDFELSERVLSKAVSIKETEQEWALLARIYEHNQSYEKAIEAMRRVHAQQ